MLFPHIQIGREYTHSVASKSKVPASILSKSKQNRYIIKDTVLSYLRAMTGRYGVVCADILHSGTKTGGKLVRNRREVASTSAATFHRTQSILFCFIVTVHLHKWLTTARFLGLANFLRLLENEALLSCLRYSAGTTGPASRAQLLMLIIANKQNNVFNNSRCKINVILIT